VNNSFAMRAVALAGVALTVLAALLAVRSPVAAALRAGRPVSAVVLGTDLVDYARHSDTLMVWNYDPRRGRVDVLSVPRDTRIHLPGYRFRRINEVFAYHFGLTRDSRAAGREVLGAVGHLLSFRPDYYVHVDYDGFRRFIDLLGGVRIHIDEPLHYDDNAGDYHFHKDPGEHHLNGSEALAYVRFRGKSGDRGRILRQMEFLKIVAGKLTFPLLTFRWPRLLYTIYDSVHTPLRPDDLVFLTLEAKHLRPDALNPWLLPGQPKGAYWEMDADRAALVVRQIRGEEAAAEHAAPGEAAADAARVTVKVWNGSRREGLALQVTRRLRAAGFDVLEWGNYNLRQGKTRILDRRGQIEKAKSVGKALGVESVFSDVNPRLQTDVEVVLGEDYVQ
jgi:polyisoprenyl-teichoic acid--peptidoglycan teichoic acid transferase